jgi:hypothetical protein
MRVTTPSTDSLSIQVIEQYLAQVTDDEKQAEEDVKRSQARLEALQLEKFDLEKTLRHLKRRAGILPATPEIPDKAKSDGKGALFERFAAERGDQGFTIADIIRVFRDQNVEIGRNYPYFLVDMRYKESLRKVGGTRNGKRYYWIENGTASD